MNLEGERPQGRVKGEMRALIADSGFNELILTNAEMTPRNMGILRARNWVEILELCWHSFEEGQKTQRGDT